MKSQEHTLEFLPAFDGRRHWYESGYCARKYRIQSHGDLKEEMKSVSRGAKRPPADAAEPSFNSVGALLRLLTPENRALLAIS